VLALAASVARAAAPVFTVNTTEDAVDAAIDGVCATSNGTCSLRAAIMEVNHRQDGGNTEATIVLPAGTYLLTLPRGGADGESDGDLDIDGYVRITGAGWDATIVDANHVDRAFKVLPGSLVTLANLRVQGGRPNRGTRDDGGGIRNEGGLRLERCLVRDNQAVNGSESDGGGIASYGPQLEVVDSVLRVNYAASSGGAIEAKNDVRIERSTVNSNTALGGSGGALHARDAVVTILNSTIAGNQSSEKGSIALDFTNGLLASTTVAGNTTGPTPLDGAGGLSSGVSTVEVRNSVLFGNQWIWSSDPGHPYAADTYCENGGTLKGSGKNVIGAATCVPNPGDFVTTDPKLGALEQNGGGFFTALPGADGSAVTHGNPDGCTDEFGQPLATDQRGVKRQIGAACDLGAVEVEPKGDANGDGAVNVADVFYLVNFLFAGGPIPKGRANVNGDSAIDVTDVFYLINFLFAGGAGPV
jgi:CSLREA domain-containing protein